jgi:hypothetical protein
VWVIFEGVLLYALACLNPGSFYRDLSICASPVDGDDRCAPPPVTGTQPLVDMGSHELFAQASNCGHPYLTSQVARITAVSHCIWQHFLNIIFIYSVKVVLLKPVLYSQS